MPPKRLMIRSTGIATNCNGDDRPPYRGDELAE